MLLLTSKFVLASLWYTEHTSRCQLQKVSTVSKLISLSVPAFRHLTANIKKFKTDGLTAGHLNDYPHARKDRRTEFSSLCRVCITCSAVKIKRKALNASKYKRHDPNLF